MADAAPEFINKDNALIWAELRYINESNARIEKTLAKMNGRVQANTEYRLTGQERWRTHEKEHDAVGRNNVIGSGLGGAFAFVAAFISQHLTK